MYTPRLCILLLFIGACFVSCKKQYSCQCGSTFEKPGYYPYTVQSVRVIDKKTTKKRAEQICEHAERQVQKNNDDYAGPSETVKTSCAVK